MKRFKNILCVVDSEKMAEHGLERAVAVAEHNQAELTVVTVAPRIDESAAMPFDGPLPADFQSAVIKNLQQALADAVKPYSKDHPIETKVLVGVPFLAIIREVLRNQRDLVVKVADQHSWLDRLLGSDDMHLLRKCPCPVWIIQPQAPKTCQHILAAVDADTAYPAKEMATRHGLNRKVLEIASSLALAEAAELHIGHAWVAVGESALRHGAFTKRPESEVNTYARSVLRKHEANLDVMLEEVVPHIGQDAWDYLKPQKHLVKGWARREIPELTKRLGVDLIVMGTVARTGISGFIMGNTAENILNRIKCSVLAIKPPGFQTPVTLEEDDA